MQVLTLDTGAVRQVVEFGHAPDGLALPAKTIGLRVAPDGASAPAAPAPAAHASAAQGAAPPEQLPPEEPQLWGLATDGQRLFVSDFRRCRLHGFRLRDPK